MLRQTGLPFKPLSPARSKTARVAGQVLDLIRTGILEVGSRLPSERELAEHLGVSRTVVREALSALQLSGVVERRVGDGTYVRSAQFMLPQSIPPMDEIEASASLVQVLEAREALDISAAKLAIENAEEDGIRAIQGIIDQMRTALERNDYQQYIHLTLDFHVAMAAAGGNPYLEQTVAMLVEITRQFVWLLERNYDRNIAENSLTVHSEIHDAIKRRDLNAAMVAVRRHYSEYPALESIAGRTRQDRSSRPDEGR